MAGEKTERVFLPAVLCAFLASALNNIGVLSVLYLTPLGVAACVWGKRCGWTAALLSMGLNTGYLLYQRYLGNLSGGLFVQELCYYLTATLVFAWVLSPPEKLRLQPAYRLMAGAVPVSLAFIPLFWAIRHDGEFLAALREQIAALTTEAGAEEVLGTIVNIGIRGGILASSVMLLFINRYAAQFLGRLFKKKPREENVDFRNDFRLVWVFSCAILVLLAALMLHIEILEIAGWNVLAFCAILYMAQGWSILSYFMIKLAMPLILKILLNIGVVVAIFTPRVQVFFLGALVLLGLAENWAPFRTLKK
jgi:hypothetical protein